MDEYEDGKVARHGGSWRAGANGARFGLMMPGSPAVGMRHCQELAPGVAMDRAEVVGVSVPFETPAGNFADCLAVEETSAIEKGRETKLYARGVGLVKDGRLRLVRRGAAGR